MLSAIDCPAGDLNGDFEVDLKDMSIFSEDWLTIGYPKLGLAALVKRKWDHRKTADFQRMFPEKVLMFVTVHPDIKSVVQFLLFLQLADTTAPMRRVFLRNWQIRGFRVVVELYGFADENGAIRGA